MWVLLYGMTWWCLLAPAHHGCLPLLNYYMKPLNWCCELTLIHLKQVRCTPEKYCQVTVQVSPPTACSWGCALPHLSLVLGLTFLNYKDLRKKKFPLNLVFSSDSILPGQVSLNQIHFKVESPKWSNLMDCFNLTYTFLVQADPTEPGQQVKPPAIPGLGWYPSFLRYPPKCQQRQDNRK